MPTEKIFKNPPLGIVRTKTVGWMLANGISSFVHFIVKNLCPCKEGTILHLETCITLHVRIVYVLYHMCLFCIFKFIFRKVPKCLLSTDYFNFNCQI